LLSAPERCCWNGLTRRSARPLEPRTDRARGGAGGPWDRPGEPSRPLTWDEINAFAPEVIVLIACGFDADRAMDEAYVLPEANPGWFDLPAVQNGECYAADGSAYFNRPGPRLAESAEILATILHPDTFTGCCRPTPCVTFPPNSPSAPSTTN
jgi:hypothetical protein